MKASIIIVTRDRHESLRGTLDALSRVHVPDGLETELIVVGNGPLSGVDGCGIRESCGKLAVRHLNEPRVGKSHGLNSAIAAATGEILIFTDDDVRPPQGWIKDITLPIADDRQDAVFGTVVLDPSLLRPWMEPLHLSWLACSQEESRSRGIAMIGANMAVSGRVFSRVPQFDPQLGPGALGFGEDVLFGMQMRTAGFRISENRGEPLVHRPSPSRLLHQAWVRAATAHGRSLAYLGHHWEHWNCRLARIRRSRMRARLRQWHQQHGDASDREGCATEEMRRTMVLATIEEHIRQSSKPRNYEFHGLVRLHDDA